jgi:hypothetical protein
MKVVTVLVLVAIAAGPLNLPTRSPGRVRGNWRAHLLSPVRLCPHAFTGSLVRFEGSTAAILNQFVDPRD